MNNTVTITAELTPEGLRSAASNLSTMAAAFEASGSSHDEPTTTDAPATGGVEVDASGIPWDARIHASTKTKTADGCWKKKRGVPDEERDRVEAELKATMAAPAAAAPEASSPTPPPAPEPSSPAPEASAPSAPAAPAPAPTPEAPAPAAPEAASPTPPPAAPAQGSITFPELMQKVTGATSAGKLNNETINYVLQEHGIASLPLLAARPDLLPSVAAKLDEYIAAAG